MKRKNQSYVWLRTAASARTAMSKRPATKLRFRIIQSRSPETPNGHLRVFTPMTVSPARIPKSVRNSTV
nr:MAG TPA: hypothetical protein [Caudoviricetes sp.]